MADPTGTYTIGDIVARTGAKERSVLMWADALAILPDGGTNRGGRGVHRQFKWRELEIAAVLAAVAPFRLPIGVMVQVGNIVRSGLNLADEPEPGDSRFAAANALATAIRSARHGEVGNLLFLAPPIGADERAWRFRLIRAPDLTAALVIDLGECWRGLHP